MGANVSHHEPLRGDLRGIQKSPAAAFFPYGRGHSIRKSLKRRKKERQKHKESNADHEANMDGPTSQTEASNESHHRKMDKLRRSFRDSFKKPKKDQHVPESSKPHTWLIDESSVRAGTCSFPVKYLGCVEVFESRGMQVCEEALKVLRNSRRRPLRGILYVSGDGLRVVDDDTKGLLVDQTIEKVSFCAPDRNHERGFSYICRDGTTKRWMCHGFIAVKETGERLSHAVGCAFAACLERKQKRDKECGVTMTFDHSTSTFTRMGSFRQMTLTERLSDPQECKLNETQVPVKKVENPHAIARPHATPQLLQRQGSFRVFNQLNQSSPFKRQLSLRLNELPSNLERTRSLTLDNAASTEDSNNVINNNSVQHQVNSEVLPPPEVQPFSQRNRLQSLPNAVTMAPIPETAPLEQRPDAVSAMCQQVSAGLSLLSNFPDAFSSEGDSGMSAMESPPDSLTNTNGPAVSPHSKLHNNLLEGGINWNATQRHDDSSLFDNPANASLGGMSKGEEWLAQLNSQNATSDISACPPSFTSDKKIPPLTNLRSASLGATPSSTSPLFSPPDVFSSAVPRSTFPAQNIDTSTNMTTEPLSPSNSKPAGTNRNDPFDAEWVSLASRSVNPNNPFLSNSITKAFEVKM